MSTRRPRSPSSLPEPPGSYGIPLIGATSKVWGDFVGFVKDAMNQTSNHHEEKAEYAHPCPLFKTAVLGYSVAVVTTDKLRHEVFGERSGDFTHKGGYHGLLSGSLGESVVTADDEGYRKVVAELFAPIYAESTAGSVMGRVYAVVHRHMKLWGRIKGGVEGYSALKQMYAVMLMEIFLGHQAKSVDLTKVIKDSNMVFTGATSFPVSGAGIFTSTYEKGKKSGKRMRALFRNLLLKQMAQLKEGGEKKEGSGLLRMVAMKLAEMTRVSDPLANSKGPHRNLLDAAAAHLTLFTTGLTSKLLASLSVSFLRVMSNPRHKDLAKQLRSEIINAHDDDDDHDDDHDLLRPLPPPHPR